MSQQLQQLSDADIKVFQYLKKYGKVNGKLSKVYVAQKLANDYHEKTLRGWETYVFRFIRRFPYWENVELDDLIKLSTGSDEDNKIVQYVIENQKLKNKLLEVTNENKRLREEYLAKDSLLEDIKKGIEALPKVNEIPKPEIFVKSRKIEEVNLILSDHHINKIIKEEETEGYNSYNFDIFCNRYWFLINEVIKLTTANRVNKKIDVLHIDFLGDMFNDIHRDEHVRTNQFNPIQASILGSYILAQGIAMLVPYFDKINITGVVGNESRLDKVKPAAEKSNNFDYLCYHIISICLATYIKQGKIKFFIPSSPEIIVEKMGWKFLLIHGDAIKSWMGIPFYGIERHTYKQQRKRRAKGGFDYMEIGHFHTDSRLKEVLMNGSLCGIDMHAYHNLSEISYPSQKFFGINSKYGVSWTYDLNCSEAKENGFIYDLSKLPPAGEVLVNSILKDKK